MEIAISGAGSRITDENLKDRLKMYNHPYEYIQQTKERFSQEKYCDLIPKSFMDDFRNTISSLDDSSKMMMNRNTLDKLIVLDSIGVNDLNNIVVYDKVPEDKIMLIKDNPLPSIEPGDVQKLYDECEPEEGFKVHHHGKYTKKRKFKKKRR